MNLDLCQIVPALVLSGLCACAGTPTMPSAVVQATGLATAGDETSGISLAAVAKTVNTSLITQGYRARIKGEQIYYCKVEYPTGSHLHSEVCRTEEEIVEQEMDGQEMAAAIRDRQGLPSRPATDSTIGQSGRR
jgi:hypothetical protein